MTDPFGATVPTSIVGTLHVHLASVSFHKKLLSDKRKSRAGSSAFLTLFKCIHLKFSQIWENFILQVSTEFFPNLEKIQNTVL